MNLLKNFKKDDILMLVVAFLLGYFAHRILKGCQIVEGAENEKNEKKCVDKLGDYKTALQTEMDEKIEIATLATQYMTENKCDMIITSGCEFDEESLQSKEQCNKCIKKCNGKSFTIKDGCKMVDDLGIETKVNPNNCESVDA